MTAQTFAEDCVARLNELAQQGRVDRRAVLAGLAALGLGIVAAPGARAQATELVIVNFGGDAVGAMTKAWAEPYMKLPGALKAVVDGSGPTSAKMKAMVESGKVTWDAVDRNLPASVELGRQGLLEKMDYALVDKAKVRPAHAGEWGIGSYIYANVLTYQTDAFGGRTPTTWKDFWNLKDFPGKRTLRKHIDGQLEAALLADGVPADKLYPIDLKRALDKIKQIKEHTIFWATGAESQQVFRDKEVVMGGLWNTRALVSKRESNNKVDFTYNEGSAWVGAWLVPKGNPAGKEVFKYIASAQDPAGQVELFKLLGNGPVNPNASALVPDDLKPVDPGSPQNYAKQIPVDTEWYATNSAAALSAYLEAIA
ncbi:MAG: ABC transporter substrate-binding protein [Alphaproteobacteria bacterium]|nr:ABC transporter substrate-binding protein [Alphaproteobacteria bacterium]